MIRIRTGTSWHHDPDLAPRCGARPGPRARSRPAPSWTRWPSRWTGWTWRRGGPRGRCSRRWRRSCARSRAWWAARRTRRSPSTRARSSWWSAGAAGAPSSRSSSLDRPSRVLARDVEVELEALAAAALQGAAEFCRELAEVAPAGSGEARRLRAAARDLRRTEAAPPPRLRPAVRARREAAAPRPGRPACLLEITDDEGVLLAYEGGRPDLGSLLAPGRLSLLAADGEQVCAVPGFPFLALRDLVAAAAGIVAAVRRRRGDASGHAGPPGPGAAGVTLRVDLAAGRVSAGGPARPAPPLALARAFAEAALELGRLARARNPRQAENAYLTELEASAAERLAQVEELRGRRPRRGAGDGARRARASRRRACRASRSGRAGCGASSFRRVFALEVGAPVGAGIHRAGGLLVVAGAEDRRGGGARLGRASCGGRRGAGWRRCSRAVLLARGDGLTALELRSGRTAWARPLPGAALTGALALARGPLVLRRAGRAHRPRPGQRPDPLAPRAARRARARRRRRSAPWRWPPPTRGSPTASTPRAGSRGGCAARARRSARPPPRPARAWCSARGRARLGAPRPRPGLRSPPLGGAARPRAERRPGGLGAAPRRGGDGGRRPGGHRARSRRRAGLERRPGAGRRPDARPGRRAARGRGAPRAGWSRSGATAPSAGAAPPPPAAPAPGTARPILARGALLVAGDGVACLDARTGQIRRRHPGRRAGAPGGGRGARGGGAGCGRAGARLPARDAPERDLSRRGGAARSDLAGEERPDAVGEERPGSAWPARSGRAHFAARTVPRPDHRRPASASAGDRMPAGYTPEEEPLPEVEREVGVEDLLGGALDVVGDAVELDHAARRCRR